MGSRGGAASAVILSRAQRIKTKLQSAFSNATQIEVEDVSYQHAGHAAMKALNPAEKQETHFNLKIVSSEFDGHSLVKRHRMVYDLLADELQSGLHALSIRANTPNEAHAASRSVPSK